MTGGQQYFVKLILPLSAPVDILEHMFDNIVPTDSPVASGVDLSALHAFIDELAQSDQRAGTLDGDIAVALEVAIDVCNLSRLRLLIASTRQEPSLLMVPAEPILG